MDMQFLAFASMVLLNAYWGLCFYNREIGFLIDTVLLSVLISICSLVAVTFMFLCG